MSEFNEPTAAMTLVAYELLTDHGLALPLFGSSASANALHVAVPSRPGDPLAHIQDFDVYPAHASVALDVSLHRTASVGTDWIDVFVWGGVVHVGTRAELWRGTELEHEEMERTAPLTLLALAEGAARGEATRCAAIAHQWLARDWGQEKADRWRVNSYLGRVAHRDVARLLYEPLKAPKARAILEKLVLVQHERVLQLRSPRVAEFGADDLPELAFEADALGWRLEVVFDPDKQTGIPDGGADVVGAMVMRLRHGRGRTQTQIPLRVFDGFFGRERNLQDARTGRARTMTLSMANGIRNTMKLQLPEIADMADPVARFERRAHGIVFEVYDSVSREGRQIADLLDEGLRDGSTLKTQGGATWWRILPL